MRVAFVHDWLTGLRGGEKCLDRMVQLFPDCEIFTLLHRPGSTTPAIESRPIHPSHLQRLPGWPKYYRNLLPLFPAAARWTLDGFDVVVSLSHCVAKAAIAPPGIPHLCYCFTPMRYAWHMKEQYFGTRRSIKSWARNRVLSRLREWDRQSSSRVTEFVAISETIADRIRDCYDRTSQVIFPPVDTDFYQLSTTQRQDYYLVVSALAPYKRIDLAVKACNRLGRKLVVIGTGQDERMLKALARPGVEWLGWQSDEEIRRHMHTCRALLFPGEEDFGIVPVEAQACGTPVIAFGRGGATETVIDANRVDKVATGLFFGEQTVESLADTIEQFESRGSEFDHEAARANALRFSTGQFDRQINAAIRNIVRVSARPAQAA